MSDFNPKKLGAVDLDVNYCTMNGVDLDMDIYYPPSGGPWPALIFVHGGGWTEGDKSGVVFNPSQFGYLFASINYRMYPADRFPAMIEDVKCAVRYLRAHARHYNLDPDHIGLIGHSAGSHLVALAGLADKTAGWDVGPYLDYSSQVQAVIAVSGPSDLSQSFPAWVENLKEDVFGAEMLVKASPTSYARNDAPPFLIIHGDADPTVPVEQAYLLNAALAKAGSPAELLILQNAGHGLEPMSGQITPSIETTFQKAYEFLDRWLYFQGKIKPPQFALASLTRLRILARLLELKIFPPQPAR